QSSPTSFGSASVRRKPSGRAPFAARSERLTRKALLATDRAASSGKKCTPPTMASVFSTRSQPSGGLMKAASSDSPSAPGWVAMGAKNRAIRRSSADLSSRPDIVSPSGAVEFAGAQASRKLIEHGVDHAGLVATHEGGGNIGVLGDDHARRHIAAMDQLIGAGPHRRAHPPFD